MHRSRTLEGGKIERGAQALAVAHEAGRLQSLVEQTVAPLAQLLGIQRRYRLGEQLLAELPAQSAGVVDAAALDFEVALIVGQRSIQRDRRKAGCRSIGLAVGLAPRQLARLPHRLIVIEHARVVRRFQIVGDAELFQPTARATIDKADAPCSKSAVNAAIAEPDMRCDANEVGCIARCQFGAQLEFPGLSCGA